MVLMKQSGQVLSGQLARVLLVMWNGNTLALLSLRFVNDSIVSDTRRKQRYFRGLE